MNELEINKIIRTTHCPTCDANRGTCCYDPETDELVTPYHPARQKAFVDMEFGYYREDD